MNTAASWFDPILAHFEAASPARARRLLYLTRTASVSVAAVRATLLIVMLHLLKATYDSQPTLVNRGVTAYQSIYQSSRLVDGDSLS